MARMGSFNVHSPSITGDMTFKGSVQLKANDKVIDVAFLIDLTNLSFEIFNRLLENEEFSKSNADIILKYLHLFQKDNKVDDDKN